MFLTLLVIAHLHFMQALGVQLQPAKPTVVAQLHMPVVTGVELQPAHVTIVKTWPSCKWEAPLKVDYTMCSNGTVQHK